MIISFHVLNIRSARLRQETLSKQSEERTFITQRSTLRSTPPRDAFEAKRRKNAQRSSLIAHHSARLRQETLSKQSEERTLNYIFIPPSTCIT
ncbi:hypothetical protein [Prevotella koreensis]|uniref:hypothetical protein n=1 Tax=Prevotella koreensis TaxID=2490854 RepID=UPI0028EE1DDA|nr:hypothetical protein [Prevotella koreensis]